MPTRLFVVTVHHYWILLSSLLSPILATASHVTVMKVNVCVCLHQLHHYHVSHSPPSNPIPSPMPQVTFTIRPLRPQTLMKVNLLSIRICHHQMSSYKTHSCHYHVSYHHHKDHFQRTTIPRKVKKYVCVYCHWMHHYHEWSPFSHGSFSSPFHRSLSRYDHCASIDQ